MHGNSIYSWEDMRHVSVQLVRNDIMIVSSFRDLLYHNHGSQEGQRKLPSKYYTSTTDLHMTCCTLIKQMFPFKMVYPSTAIDVADDKPLFLRQGKSPTGSWSSHDVLGHSVCVVCDDPGR